jgi:hypothetical protein
MRKLLFLLCLFLFAQLNSQAQQVNIKVDSLQTILEGSATEDHKWFFCKSIYSLFTSDTIVLHSNPANTSYPYYCQSDTISEIDFNFNGDKTLISEKSYKRGSGIHISFSLLNTFECTIIAENDTFYLRFKNHQNTYSYTLVNIDKVIEGEQAKFILMFKKG